MKFFFYLPLLFLLTTAKSQQSFIKPAILGVHFFVTDFNTPIKIKDKGIAQLFHPDTKNMKPGLAFSYLKGLSDHFDISVMASGNFIDYPIKNKPAFETNSLLLQLMSMTNLKLNTDQKFFTPYVTAGAGISKYKEYYGLFIPAGLGLQFNFKREVYLLIQSHYSFALTSNASDNLYHSIGIAGNIKRKRQAHQGPLPKPPTVDLSKQDRDGDGITDSDDKCPTVPGVAKYAGCPIPDTDNDGINDEEDKCPAVYGLARYQGCPIPDTDKDGVNDEEDNCVNEKGPSSNKGCPVTDTIAIQKINTAAKQIFFETGKAILLEASYNPLDEIAAILADNSSFKVSIEGHTDNEGNKAANQVLSEKRAKVVLQYLAGKGIVESRMQSKGFGQDKPVSNNNTAEGRSKNRRVEIKIGP
jgi:OmpA-OmpF porin, OOP family